MTDLERLILRHVAHRAGEDTDNRGGWCRWSTSDRWPWAWSDYRPLVERGLLERRETWKDVLLKLTSAGWTALYATPMTGRIDRPNAYRTPDVLLQIVGPLKFHVEFEAQAYDWTTP